MRHIPWTLLGALLAMMLIGSCRGIDAGPGGDRSSDTGTAVAPSDDCDGAGGTPPDTEVAPASPSDSATRTLSTDEETDACSDPEGATDGILDSSDTSDPVVAADTEHAAESDDSSNGGQGSNTDAPIDTDAPLPDPCLDIDCSRRGRCEVHGHRAVCICNPGFAPEGLACLDVDECRARDHGCREDERCVNVIGGHRCVTGECAPPPHRNLAGHAFDATLVGDRLFVASGLAGVRVYGVSASSKLSLLGELSTLAQAVRIQVSGENAYVLGELDGAYLLEVLDVGDPTRPEQMAVKRLPHPVLDVALWGEYLFVLDGKLSIYDLRDPAAPTLIHGLFLGHPIRDIAVEDGYVYGASEEGWLVVDARDPQNPSIVSETYYDAPAMSYDDRPVVAVGGGRLYLNRTRVVEETEVSEVQVYDLSTPGAPRLSSTVTLDGLAHGITPLDGRVLVTREDGGLEVVDLRDPGVPAVSTVASGYHPTFTRCVPGASMCAAWTGIDIQLLDVSNPDAPTIADALSFPYRPRLVQAKGPYAFVAEENRLFLIDAGDSAAPVVRRQIPFEGTIVDMALGEGVLYISVYREGLYALDVTRPETAAPVAAALPVAHMLELALSDGYLYAVNEYYESGSGTTRNLHVIDVRDPLAPEHTGHVAISSTINDVLVVGDHAYLNVHYSTALYVVDVSDKASPLIAGTYTLPETTFAGSILAYDAPYLYVGLVESQTALVDLSDPAAPQAAGLIQLHGRPRSYLFDATTMYVVDSMNTLFRMDNSDRFAPRCLGAYDVAGEAWSAALSDGRLYVISDGGGLEVVDTGARPRQSILSELLPGEYLAAARVVGDELFLASVNPVGYIDDSSTFRRFDISDLAHPVQTGSVFIEEGRVYRIDVAGNHAYTAEFYNPESGNYNSGRVSILNIGHPDRVTSVDRLAFDFSVFDLDMGDAYGAAVPQYYNSRNSRLWATLATFRIPDTGPAVPLNEIPLSSQGLVDIAVNGATLWMVDGTDSLQAWDIRGENGPVLLASQRIDGDMTHLCVDEQDRAFVSALTEILVFDIADPISPARLTAIETGGLNGRLAVKGTLLYVEGDFAGDERIKVFDVSELDDPAVINTIDHHSGDFDVLDDGKLVVTGGYGALFYDPFLCEAAGVIDGARPVQ